MSNDEYLRQQTQDQLRNNPSTEKANKSQIPNSHDRLVVNNEIERVRREQDNRK